jgi:hypothetical protein
MTFNLHNAAHLILEIIGSLLRGDNISLLSLILTCKKFHDKRIIWINNMYMKYIPKRIYFPEIYSKLLGNINWFRNKPLYWNHVYKVHIDFDLDGSSEQAKSFIFNDLKNVNTIFIDNWTQSSIGPFSSKNKFLLLTSAKYLTFINNADPLHSLSLIYPSNNLKEICSTGLKKLSLNYCSSISEFALTPNLTILKLTSCENITKISNLRFLDHLHIQNVDHLYEISNLPMLTNLKIYKCPVKNLTNLPKIKTLSLSKCPNFTNLEQLSHIKKYIRLKQIYIPINSDLNYISHVNELYLEECHSITNLEPLSHIPILFITNCNGIRNFLVKMYNKKLHIDNMQFTDISGLNNVNEITFMKCLDIFDLSPLKDCHIVRLLLCNKNLDTTPLTNVKYLFKS